MRALFIRLNSLRGRVKWCISAAWEVDPPLCLQERWQNACSLQEAAQAGLARCCLLSSSRLCRPAQQEKVSGPMPLYCHYNCTSGSCRRWGISDLAYAQVVPRQTALLPALLLGWASLAACAILPGMPATPACQIMCLLCDMLIMVTG